MTDRSRSANKVAVKLGRPKEFDREEALEKAMHVFWSKGYEGATIRDLLDGMGIHRGSLYATFGDKRALLLQAVDLYQKKVTSRIVGLLDAPGSPRENIRRTLERAAETAEQKCQGCFLTNLTVEVAPHDDGVAGIVRTAMRTIEDALQRAVRRAIEAEEVSKEADSRELARFLLMALQGTIVLAKARMGRPVVQHALETALSVLR